MRMEVEVEMVMWIVEVLWLSGILDPGFLELVRLARELRRGYLGTLERPRFGDGIVLRLLTLLFCSKA